MELLIGGLAIGLFVGGAIGFCCGGWCGGAGREDAGRELYATQVQLTSATELNGLLMERIQELEDRLTILSLEPDLTRMEK